MECAGRTDGCQPRALEGGRIQDVPERAGDEFARGQFEVVHTKLLARIGVEPAVPGDSGAHEDLAQTEFGSADAAVLVGDEDLDVGRRPRLGVLAAIGGFHESDMVVEVE